jgi:VanZ family protein
MGSPAYNPVLYRAVFWVMCLSIFVLAILPNNPSSIVFLHADKVGHAMAFAGVSFIGCLAYPVRIVVLAIFLVFLGAAIEVTQGFTPDRSRDLFDFFADVVGISLGFITYRLSERGFLRK